MLGAGIDVCETRSGCTVPKARPRGGAVRDRTGRTTAACDSRVQEAQRTRSRYHRGWRMAALGMRNRRDWWILDRGRYEGISVLSKRYPKVELRCQGPVNYNRPVRSAGYGKPCYLVSHVPGTIARKGKPSKRLAPFSPTAAHRNPSSSIDESGQRH